MQNRNTVLVRLHDGTLHEQTAPAHHVALLHERLRADDSWLSNVNVDRPTGEEEQPSAEDARLAVLRSVYEAATILRSDEGENIEYDRALIELVATVKISLLESLCGWNKIIRTIDGKKINIERSDVTPPSWSQSYAGLGMPLDGMAGKRSDMIVKVDVEYPESISPYQGKIFKQLQPLTNSRPAITREGISNRQRAALRGAEALATILDFSEGGPVAEEDLLITRCYTWCAALRSLTGQTAAQPGVNGQTAAQPGVNGQTAAQPAYMSR